VSLGSPIRFAGLLGTIVAYGTKPRTYWCAIDSDKRGGVRPDDSPIYPGIPYSWWLVAQKFVEVPVGHR
jgi:hypothetical protein